MLGFTARSFSTRSARDKAFAPDPELRHFRYPFLIWSFVVVLPLQQARRNLTFFASIGPLFFDAHTAEQSFGSREGQLGERHQ